MTTSVFSTVDRFSSRIQPLDRLISSVAARLLPQHEARAVGCVSGTYPCDSFCGNFCNPTTDVYRSTYTWCCYTQAPAPGDHAYYYHSGCDNCPW
jgi:hypothetical protein